jgi:formylglycine-generating enzyme required for sulfatase activity/predicted Ser/Thr protein kinase
MIGRNVSHYQILEKLGEGGMGVVYRARDTRLDRTVAIKIVHPDAAASRQRRERFAREAKAASALNHSHIVTIHDIDHDSTGGADRDFIVMEYVDGASLDRVLEQKLLPVPEALGYAIQIASALGAAHAAGIVHRDVKPANVMLSKRGEAKLVDFGLAKLVEPQSGDDSTPTVSAGLKTEQGTVLGTPSYMSPEQAEGRVVDSRSDVFSFGSVLYEMLTGRRPFQGDSQVSVRKAILSTTPPAPRAVRPEIPPELERIVLRCLQKEPEARYPSGAELLRELDAIRRRVEIGPPLWRRPRVVVPLGLALVAALAGATWLWVRAERVEQARRALPEIARLAAEDHNEAAFRLARQVRPYLAGDSEAERLWESLTWEYSASTEPEGAEVSWKSYSEPDSAWEPLGRTPIERVRLPFAQPRWRIEKAGFETVELAPRWTLRVKLHPSGSVPKGMVWVPGGDVQVNGKAVAFGGFWLDQYEVTNRQFQEFVNAGGYRKPQYWGQPLFEDNRELSGEEAMRRFVDRTGRPGPSTWEAGAYPAGEDEFPVRGVSWYEAAAYAEFVGKSLPTVHHWLAATDPVPPVALFTLSNFDGKGPVPAGTRQGLGRAGTYDMAGNVKEWCWNASGEKRYTLGGGWDEPIYMYRAQHAQPAFDRRENQGLRLAKYVEPPAAALLEPISRTWRDYARERPVDDAAFEVFRSIFAYDRSPLDAVVERLPSAAPQWTKEKITVNAAYGGEKLIAYLFLPANAAPPFQTVVFFPGSAAENLPRLLEPELSFFDFVIRSGRAVLHPIYKNTYERRLKDVPPWPSRAHRDLQVQQVQDALRSVDYLETRPDVDKSRIAYYGFSWGANMGLRITALDRRFKASILMAGGLGSAEPVGIPEADGLNFAPRVRTPTLMLNGRDDFRFPLEESQRPMFRLLGTRPEDKQHFLFDGGHIPGRLDPVKPTLEWLDRYLGPVGGS